MSFVVITLLLDGGNHAEFLTFKHSSLNGGPFHFCVSGVATVGMFILYFVA